MLAIVHYQQRPPAGERLRDALRRRLAAAQIQSDSGRDGGGNQARIREGGELGQPHPVGKVRQQLAGKGKRKSGLPDAAGAGQRDEPMLADEAHHLIDLGIPAYQLGNRLWCIGRRQDR